MACKVCFKQAPLCYSCPISTQACSYQERVSAAGLILMYKSEVGAWSITRFASVKWRASETYASHLAHAYCPRKFASFWGNVSISVWGFTVYGRVSQEGGQGAVRSTVGSAEHMLCIHGDVLHNLIIAQASSRILHQCRANMIKSFFRTHQMPLSPFL